MADLDMVSKAEVLDIYAELYDEFDDAPGIIKVLHKVFDKLKRLQSQEPVEPKWASGIKGGADALCGSCSAWLSDHSWAYCPRCGKSVKWE